jgi:hypothetical protein
VVGALGQLCIDTLQSDLTGTPASPLDPQLADSAPVDHGGPTPTIGLSAGSPALGKGVASLCSSPTASGVDQRGLARPSSGCDVGAYQHGPFLASAVVTSTGSGTAVAGSEDTPITLSGHDFDVSSGISVQIASARGSISAKDVAVQSESQATAVIPRVALTVPGAIEITVKNTSDGTISDVATFYVVRTTASVTGAGWAASGSAGSPAAAAVGGYGADTPGNIAISASGGTGEVSNAMWGGDPTGTNSSKLAGYFAIHTSLGSSFQSIAIADCALGAGNTALYWYSTTGHWVRVTNMALPQSYNSSTSCATATIDPASSPAVAAGATYLFAAAPA